MITKFIGIVGQGQKVHAHRNSWAMCGAGRITVIRTLETGDQDRICKRCAKHLDQPVRDGMDHYERIAAVRSMRYAVTADTKMRDLYNLAFQAIREITWSAAERAELDGWHAGFVARMEDPNRGVTAVTAPEADWGDTSWVRKPFANYRPGIVSERASSARRWNRV